MNTVNWPELLAALAEPFPASAIQWRAGAKSRDHTKAMALPYAESREYEKRLDEVCAGDWSVRFLPWGETRIICELTIAGVTRSSTGEAGDSSGEIAGTAAEAQAFKRACSKFGLGRYLYDIPAVWVAYDPQKRQLLETPKLPAKFTPQPARQRARSLEGSPIGADEDLSELPGPIAEPTLGKERAHAMHVELGKVVKTNQYQLASQVLGREIKSFTDLTESEAVAVWKAAKEAKGATKPARGRAGATSRPVL